MTPQTRALIEAAEAVVNEWNQEHHGLALLRAVHKLEAAISSAKAAEEGVETKWRIDFRRGAQWNRGMGNPEEDLDAQEQVLLENRTIEAIRRVRRDTYTTVIEVREKEGLHANEENR